LLLSPPSGCYEIAGLLESIAPVPFGRGVHLKFATHIIKFFPSLILRRCQEIRKPKVAPWKRPKEEKDMFYIEEGAGQAPGNDPVMFLVAVAGILGLSYVFLG